MELLLYNYVKFYCVWISTEFNLESTSHNLPDSIAQFSSLQSRNAFAFIQMFELISQNEAIKEVKSILT